MGSAVRRRVSTRHARIREVTMDGFASIPLFRRRLAADGEWRKHAWRLTVSWIGDRPPQTEEAELVREAVVHRGLRTYAEVATYVAEQLYRRDLRRAGPLSDIGFFRTWYLAAACQALERMAGRDLRIDETGTEPPCPR
jgi:hypothetical protein